MERSHTIHGKMRTWNLKAGDPLQLTLAADARTSVVNYSDDQAWEMTLGGGDPPALALRTTFGLRARAFRLFNQFHSGEEIRCDPGEFHRPPVFTRVYPNFITLHYAPFDDVDVTVDTWVPGSRALCGRLSIHNKSRHARHLRVDWVALLNPTEGQRMAPQDTDVGNYLSGQTANLAPVLVVAAHVKGSSSPYQGLSAEMDLAPGKRQEINWAHAATGSSQESLLLAQSYLEVQWAAEIARLDLLNAQQVDIETGDPGWDAALMLSQKCALGLVMNSPGSLPHPSIVLSRGADQGYSWTGDGSDYTHLWNGQPVWETFYLAGILGAANPELAAGWLRNYLAVQIENGQIDNKPGIAGQRSRMLAAPLLVRLCWDLFESSGDEELLEEAYPALRRFFDAWFEPVHDRDGDGVPEWEHPIQAGYEDHPLYSGWVPGSSGLDIASAECSSLCALLFSEGRALLHIAEQLGQPAGMEAVSERCTLLQQTVQACWDADQSNFFDRDRDIHTRGSNELLAERLGAGQMAVGPELTPARRLLIQVEDIPERNRPRVTIIGIDAAGNPALETRGPELFHWFGNRGCLTSQAAYAQITQLTVEDIFDRAQVRVYSACYQSLDQTGFAALWSGAADAEQAQAYINHTLTSEERFWKVFGLPGVVPGASQAGTLPDSKDEQPRLAHLVWNKLAGEGLVSSGERQLAARLVEKVMRAVIQNLKQERAFRAVYHVDNGQGVGGRNEAGGLAPLGLFLDVLGVKLHSPHKVSLYGFNPFPWPVTVKYRGLVITRQVEKTLVVFPDGQSVIVNDPAAHTIALELAGERSST